MSCAPILACHLAYLQLEAVNALTDSVAVRRKTATTADGAGGLKPSSGDGWTTVATIAGLLTPVGRRSPSERLMADQIIAIADHYVYVAHGADVRAQDRLVIGTRTFESQGGAKGESVQVLDQISCVELQK